MKMINGKPRRCQSEHWSEAEWAIYGASVIVEAAGAHQLLTEASQLLSQARNKIADYVEIEPADAGALAFMKQASEIGRIVSENDLEPREVERAKFDGRYQASPDNGPGWVILPWYLTTEEDRKRESAFFRKSSEVSV